MSDAGSAAWSIVWRSFYALVRLSDPLIRLYLALGGWGLDRFVELHVTGRRSARTRRVLLTLLTTGGRAYIGHPNGHAAWVRNLDAAGTATLVADGVRSTMRAIRLAPGEERDAVIVLAPSQQPFPASLLYRAARGHILRVGVYYRLEPQT